MNTIPMSRQRSANCACSATKPHPTQTASARAVAQRALKVAVVDVNALEMIRARIDDLRGAERHRLVGLTNEHGVAVGVGEKRDGAQRCAALLIELACCVDETHRGFTAID